MKRASYLRHGRKRPLLVRYPTQFVGHCLRVFGAAAATERHVVAADRPTTVREALRKGHLIAISGWIEEERARSVWAVQEPPYRNAGSHPAEEYYEALEHALENLQNEWYAIWRKRVSQKLVEIVEGKHTCRDCGCWCSCARTR